LYRYIFILFILANSWSFSQAPAENGIIEFPDVEAKFPGGVYAMQKYIANTVVYPPKAIIKNITGKVYVVFIVEPDGSISNVKAKKGTSKILRKEAERVVRKMPKWDAGEANGRKVRVRCLLPINFTLN